jgi:hypothetical protein
MLWLVPHLLGFVLFDMQLSLSILEGLVPGLTQRPKFKDVLTPVYSGIVFAENLHTPSHVH